MTRCMRRWSAAGQAGGGGRAEAGEHAAGAGQGLTALDVPEAGRGSGRSAVKAREDVLNSRTARLVACPICQRRGAVSCWYPQGKELYYGTFCCGDHGRFPRADGGGAAEGWPVAGPADRAPGDGAGEARRCGVRRNEPVRCRRKRKNEKAPVRRGRTKPAAPKGAAGFVLLRVQRKEEHLGEENDQEEVMMIEVNQTECTPAPKSVSSMTTTVAVMQKGMTSRKSFSTLMDLSRLLATNRHAPKGGVMLPTAMPIQNTTPRWIMLMPRAAAAGQTSGPTIR